MSKPREITIDEVKYVRADNVPQLSDPINGLQYVIVRSRDAGCHAGYLKKENETSVELVNSRRMWFWSGALTLSELAMNGVENPDKCKFGCVLPNIKIYNQCEVIPTSNKGYKSIQEVKEWKK